MLDEPDGMSLTNDADIAVEAYLALSRIDRLSVYRRLGPADRMRLSRQVSNRKKRSKRSFIQVEKVATMQSGDTDLSHRLVSELNTIMTASSNRLGPKTVSYLREALGISDGA